MTLKYPLKLGATSYPAGTEVEPASSDELKKTFPRLAPNLKSNFIGIILPDIKGCMIVDRAQLAA